jgi:hypothetical protein
LVKTLSAHSTKMKAPVKTFQRTVIYNELGANDQRRRTNDQP